MADVTVLMAVYNGEAYLRQAIESVFAQTYADFEFVIVDDGSTDRTEAICARYSDSRLRYIRLTSNGGLSAALNTGLAAIRTDLVARLDADDVAEPERLARQRAVMLSRPVLALLGGQAVAITPDGVERGTVRRSLESAGIRWTSVFDNPFIHPTVMFRASVVRDELSGYRREFDPFSQDYDLWCRVMERHEVANLPDRLIRHRVHESSIMGQLGRSGHRPGYDDRFDGIARTLIVRQARRLFGQDVLSDEALQVVPGLILGLPASDLSRFLDVFETILSDFRSRYPTTRSADFASTLARQFDGLAMRVFPTSRRSTARVYSHALRQHPEVRVSLSWSRTLALVLLGKSGRDRVGAWSRRYLTGVVD
jgi:glycosyltransferase involved in cell wall biosynthesis